jgi:hypothetical protein
MFSTCTLGIKSRSLRRAAAEGNDDRHPLPPLISFWNPLFYPSTTKCDEAHSRNIQKRIPSADNPYKDQIEQMQRELNEQCQTCMYTGMAVCSGLSLYFAKLAIDNATLPKNRRFLWACSAGSLLTGTYRWYLG